MIDIRGEDHGIGIKKLTMNELQFGRYAENPVMPGVLVMPAGISTYMSHSSAKRSSKRSKKAAQAAQRGLSGVVRHNRIMASTRIAETDRRPPMGLVKRHYVVAVFPPAGRALP